MVHGKQHVLIALLGMSPAVVTETVWELIQTKKIPLDEIVILTTRAGKDAFAKQVLDSGVWARMSKRLSASSPRLREALTLGTGSFKLFLDQNKNEADDIQTEAGHLKMADFMMQTLRGYTDNPDTVLHVSIAGGRKTMSALLLSCLSLVGREQDSAYHVLVNSPRDNSRLEPPFFFPEGKKRRLPTPDGSIAVKDADAGLTLFEVPYVRMRELYQNHFRKSPPTYKALVSQMQQAINAADIWPALTVDLERGEIGSEGMMLPAKALGYAEFAVLALLAQGCPREKLLDILSDARKREANPRCDWFLSFKEASRFKQEANQEDDLAKVLCSLRKRLEEKLTFSRSQAEALVPKRRGAPTWPQAKIAVRGTAAFAEIRGYPFLPKR